MTTTEPSDTVHHDAAPISNDSSECIEENQYGLQDLAKLPLLEQVHRLFHAIQMKYPYKETTAWKSMPLDQKQRMLEYIRDKRTRQAAAAAATKTSANATPTTIAPPARTSVTPPSATPQPSQPMSASTATPVAVKTDPYLQMLQRRTVTTTHNSGLTGTADSNSAMLFDRMPAHPNSAYIAPAQIARYTERMTHAARWRVIDSEFDNSACSACSAVHAPFSTSKSAKSALLSTVAAMMSTFGDVGRPCALAVQHVKTVVGEHIRTMLAQLDADELHAGPGLRALVEVFHEEALYYGRWREFRTESKHEQHELEDVEEDDLAEELDLFAVSEADTVFNTTFVERIRFADERTQSMDWGNYDAFARGRKLNFLSAKGQQFRQWLRLAKSSRAALEFMNFVAYHNIGRLVELAIKRRSGGELLAMTSALPKSDIDAVTSAFHESVRAASAAQQAIAVDTNDRTVDATGARAAKAQRVSTMASDVPTALQTATVSVEPSTLSPECVAQESANSSNYSSALTPASASKPRPTRLKRLR